jgi:carbon monoxide dehydrogenase subunit G
MLKTIAIIVVVAIVAILVYAATRPDDFRVQRSTSIKAPPEKIFALINDFHRWDSWSPWEKMDPAMKRTYSGTASGKGAMYAWQGNSKVGEGRMEIADASPPSKVTIKLDFVKPIEGHNTAEFTLLPDGDSTNVTWVMYGPSAYVAKLIGIFVSMDKMIGNDFETGLDNMKAVAEK